MNFNNKDNEQIKKKKQEQILIEDGTMSAFNFNNPCEILIEDEQKIEE